MEQMLRTKTLTITPTRNSYNAGEQADDDWCAEMDHTTTQMLTGRLTTMMARVVRPTCLPEGRVKGSVSGERRPTVRSEDSGSAWCNR